jgi:hypothetical protein
MSKQRVSRIARDYLCEKGERAISSDQLDYLADIYERAHLRGGANHPLNRCDAVVRALNRDSKRPDAIFSKFIFVSWRRHCCFEVK